MSDSSLPIPDPVVLVPANRRAEVLFVLLHDDAASPDQLESLKKALLQAFPQAALALFYGPLASAVNRHHWFEQQGLNEYNYVGRVESALPRLVAHIQWVQKQLELDADATALCGFGQGATLALEATLAHAGLAGRVLAFSGCHARLPAVVSPHTTMHLLHGANDPVVPQDAMKAVHAHVSDLGGDATLDIASGVGHELHPALLEQAVHRLQTYVPMRRWKEAMSTLKEKSCDPDDGIDTTPPPGTTLH